jgi:uncharacterized RDD family membrane protein YckC
MRYAGFWPRLGAIVVDTVVLVPVIMLSFWAFSESRTIALAFEIPIACLFALYSIYFVGRWGQTIGKMALGIKVVAVDGESAGYLRAFYRHAVDLAFSLATSALTLYALMSVTSREFDLMDVDARLELLTAKTGNWTDILNWLLIAWTLSELVVLLFNEKRRAIHDYIAGTVVIHAREPTTATCH